MCHPLHPSYIPRNLYFSDHEQISAVQFVFYWSHLALNGRKESIATIIEFFLQKRDSCEIKVLP